MRFGIIQKGEIRKLLSLARNMGRREHLMILLSYGVALRVSELVHIRVSDFDFASSSVQILALRRKYRDKISCPIDPSILDEVDSYISEEGLNKDSYLFPGRARKSCNIVSYDCPGGHISKREVQIIFDRLATKAGVKKRGYGIQALKHARLLDVAKKTRDPFEVQRVGHYGALAMGARYIERADAEGTK